MEDVSAHVIEIEIKNDDDDDGKTSCYFHLPHIDDDENCAAFTATVHNATITHGLTWKQLTSRYAGKFYGVMIDTGCARRSSGG